MCVYVIGDKWCMGDNIAEKWRRSARAPHRVQRLCQRAPGERYTPKSYIVNYVIDKLTDRAPDAAQYDALTAQ